MNDFEAIRRLMADYCFGTDTGDTDAWVECFTDDIIWDGGAFGRFDSREEARAYHGAAGDAIFNFRHINTNHRIDVQGDRATVASYVQVYDQSATPPALMFSGFYDDELVRQNGRWLIRRRKLVADARELRASESAVAA